MPRADYKTCKSCGRHTSEVGSLSRQRLCEECGQRNLRENIDGLHRHETHIVKRWRRGVAASVGAVLLDDGPAAP